MCLPCCRSLVKPSDMLACPPGYGAVSGGWGVVVGGGGGGGGQGYNLVYKCLERRLNVGLSLNPFNPAALVG